MSRSAKSHSRALAERPVPCDLISAQAAVLERNVSPQVAAQYKRAAIANAQALAGRVAAHLPELGAEGAFRFIAGTIFEALPGDRTRVRIFNTLEGHGLGKLLVGLAVGAARKDAPDFGRRIKAAVEAS
ncbi:hypothetical protein [Streptomyces sp. KS 21]|uniref:hypothetical protein n=1 Tax=Streptomyces sp. KS 21 TaxID=2485150 RepID=UPI001FB8BB75|nr:hypothetical protein [Streptomyces sp. KS 21]